MSYHVIQNLSTLQWKWNQNMSVFQNELFSDWISKIFAHKTAWYHKVFQIITLQPRCKILLFQQGCLEWTTSKHMCLCFGFSGLERREDWYDMGKFLKLKYCYYCFLWLWNTTSLKSRTKITICDSNQKQTQ